MAKPNPEAMLAVKLFAVQLQNNPVIKGISDFDAQSYNAVGKIYHRAMNQAVTDATRLMSLARSIHRLDEEAATYAKLSNKKQQRCESMVVAARNLLHSYGLEVTRKIDTRGKPLYIHFPDGSFNTLGGQESGWGI